LGLPLTRNLVELHGGSFEIASEPGQGTVVRVTFPYADPSDATRSASSKSAA
jgi:signal transduction histidine kinase